MIRASKNSLPRRRRETIFSPSDSGLTNSLIILPQLEGSAAYNLTVDLDVDAIGADSECTHAQIVYVLAVIDSEV